MTKMENLLNLASKLNVTVNRIDDITIKIKKPVEQIMRLANKLGITVIVAKTKKAEQPVKQEPQHALSVRVKYLNACVCFLCNKPVAINYVREGEHVLHPDCKQLRDDYYTQNPKQPKDPQHFAKTFKWPE